MKKLLMSAAMAAMFATVLSPAQAATVNGFFNVSVALTAKCTANSATSGTGPTVNFGTYTALTNAAVTPASVNVTFNCTRGLTAPTVAFDTGSGHGVLAGLHYLLTASAPSTAVANGGSTGTAATAAAGGVGSADVYGVAVSGTMDANQAGDCGGGTSAACVPATATAARYLVLTY